MRLPKFEYVEPDSVEECCKLLEEEGERAFAFAGGTDLLASMKNGLKNPKVIVDLQRIPDLQEIHYSEQNGLRIGPMVPLRRLTTHCDVNRNYPILSCAAKKVGSVQLQTMGTVGGNLCQDNCCLYYNRATMWRAGLQPCHKLGGSICHAVGGSETCWATYCGDIAPVLLVLDAKIKVVDADGSKMLPLEALYSGDGKRPLTLRPGQIITQIQIPSPSPNSGGAYLKMRVRKAIDYPLLGVTVHLVLGKTDNTLENLRVALTGIGKQPVMVKAPVVDGMEGNMSARVEGMAEIAHKAAHPIRNTFGYSPKYRREMVKVYVREATRQALAYAEKKGGMQ